MFDDGKRALLLSRSRNAAITIVDGSTRQFLSYAEGYNECIRCASEEICRIQSGLRFDSLVARSESLVVGNKSTTPTDGAKLACGVEKGIG